MIIELVRASARAGLILVQLLHLTPLQFCWLVLSLDVSILESKSYREGKKDNYDSKDSGNGREANATVKPLLFLFHFWFCVVAQALLLLLLLSLCACLSGCPFVR